MSKVAQNNGRVRTCAVKAIFYFLRRQERRSVVHKFESALFIRLISPSKHNINDNIFGSYDNVN